MSDIKDGEVVIASTLVLEQTDPVFNPETRPKLEDAINLIIGQQRGYEIPFASISLDIHKNLPEQNLFRCLFGRDALLVADLLSSHRHSFSLASSERWVRCKASMMFRKARRSLGESPMKFASPTIRAR